MKTLPKKLLNVRQSVGIAVLSVAGLGVMSSTALAADLSVAAVEQYATAMKQAANSKNIGSVSNLVADDALISMSRNGKTTSLDKAAYLKLLQDSWSKTNGYRYDISIDNVVISGSQAKANVKTTETWQENGKATTLTTSSRATLTTGDNAGSSNALLLRAVAQVTIK